MSDSDTKTMNGGVKTKLDMIKRAKALNIVTKIKTAKNIMTPGRSVTAPIVNKLVNNMNKLQVNTNQLKVTKPKKPKLSIHQRLELMRKKTRNPNPYGPKKMNCSTICNGASCDKCRCILHNVINQPVHGLCWLISIVHVLSLSDVFQELPFLQQRLQTLDFRLDMDIADHLDKNVVNKKFTNHTANYNLYVNQLVINVNENEDFYKITNKSRFKKDISKPNLIQEYIIDDADIQLNGMDPTMFCPLTKDASGSYNGMFSYKFITPFLVHNGFRYADLKHISFDIEYVKTVYNRYNTTKQIQSGRDIRYLRVFADYLSYISGIGKVYEIDHNGTKLRIHENAKVLIVSSEFCVEAYNAKNATFKPLYLGKYIIYIKTSTNTQEKYLVVYELDSMILSSFAVSDSKHLVGRGNNPGHHAICCITCNDEEYIVNSHQSKEEYDGKLKDVIQKDINTCTVFKYPWKSWKPEHVYCNSYDRAKPGCFNARMYDKELFDVDLYTEAITYTNPKLKSGKIPDKSNFYHRDLGTNVFIYAQKGLQTEAGTSKIQDTTSTSIKIFDYIFALYNSAIRNSPIPFQYYVLPYFIYFTYKMNQMIQKMKLSFITPNVFLKYDPNVINDYILSKRNPMMTEHFISDTSRHPEIFNITPAIDMIKSPLPDWKTYVIDYNDFFIEGKIYLHKQKQKQYKPFDIAVFRHTIDAITITLKDIMPEDFIISMITNCNHDNLPMHDYKLLYAVHVKITDSLEVVQGKSGEYFEY